MSHRQCTPPNFKWHARFIAPNVPYIRGVTWINRDAFWKNTKYLFLVQYLFLIAASAPLALQGLGRRVPPPHDGRRRRRRTRGGRSRKPAAAPRHLLFYSFFKSRLVSSKLGLFDSFKILPTDGVCPASRVCLSYDVQVVHGESLVVVVVVVVAAAAGRRRRNAVLVKGALPTPRISISGISWRKHCRWLSRFVYCNALQWSCFKLSFVTFFCYILPCYF